MPRTLKSLALAIALSAACSADAQACPFCNGGPDGVNEVRDEIFARSFWRNVARVVLPFPIFGAVIAAIHFGFNSEPAIGEPEAAPSESEDSNG